MRTTLPPDALPPLNWNAYSNELLCMVFVAVATLVVALMFAMGTAAPKRDQQCAAARVVQRTRTEHDASWI